MKMLTKTAQTGSRMHIVDRDAERTLGYGGYREMCCRILVIILSLSLMMPLASAVEGTNWNLQSGAATTGVRETQEPVSATTSTQPKAPEPLGAEEDASLSARTEEPGPEVAGGALSNLHLTYAVIALAAMVLVLILK